MIIIRNMIFLVLLFVFSSCQKQQLANLTTPSDTAQQDLTTASQEAAALPGSLPVIYSQVIQNRGLPPGTTKTYSDYYVQDMAYNIKTSYQALQKAVNLFKAAKDKTSKKQAMNAVQGQWQNIRYYENIFWLCFYENNYETTSTQVAKNYYDNFKRDWRYTTVGEMPFFCNKQDLPSERCPVRPFALEDKWNRYDTYSDYAKDFTVTLDVPPRNENALPLDYKNDMTKVLDDDFTTIHSKEFNAHWLKGFDSFLGGNNEAESYDPNQVALKPGTGVVLSMRNCKSKIGECVPGVSFVSGKIYANTPYAISTGCFEFEAQVPSGTGLWPAAWMLAQETGGTSIYLGNKLDNKYWNTARSALSNCACGVGVVALYCCTNSQQPKDSLQWPTKGEIDVLEINGGDTHTLHSTLHTGLAVNSDHPIGNLYYNPHIDYSSGFHTFTSCWDNTGLRFYMNRNLIKEINFKNITDVMDASKSKESKGAIYKSIFSSGTNKFAPIFNLAFGGAFDALHTMDNGPAYLQNKEQPKYNKSVIKYIVDKIKNNTPPQFIIRRASLYEYR